MRICVDFARQRNERKCPGLLPQARRWVSRHVHHSPGVVRQAVSVSRDREMSASVRVCYRRPAAECRAMRATLPEL